MKKYLSIGLFMILLLSACTAQDNSLVGNWRLTSYGPEGSLNLAVADSNAELTFNEDCTVNGNSGCNGFGGEYTVEGDQITFSELFSTLMACEEPAEPAAQEFLAAWERADYDTMYGLVSNETQAKLSPEAFPIATQPHSPRRPPASCAPSCDRRCRKANSCAPTITSNGIRPCLARCSPIMR